MHHFATGRTSLVALTAVIAATGRRSSDGLPGGVDPGDQGSRSRPAAARQPAADRQRHGVSRRTVRRDIEAAWLRPAGPEPDETQLARLATWRESAAAGSHMGPKRPSSGYFGCGGLSGKSPRSSRSLSHRRWRGGCRPAARISDRPRVGGLYVVGFSDIDETDNRVNFTRNDKAAAAVPTPINDRCSNVRRALANVAAGGDIAMDQEPWRTTMTP